MTTIHTRENGYYWVYPKDEKETVKYYWVIAEWRENKWYLHGLEKPFNEDFFKHIHEVQIFHPPLPCYAHAIGYTPVRKDAEINN
jgi:hypothetical protein